MNRRERLRRCYNQEELDRPAVYSRMWISDSDRSYDGLRAYVAERMELKRWFFANRYKQGDKPLEAVEPVSQDWRRRVFTLRTPLGELRSGYMESLHGQPGHCEEHYLKDRQDAERLLSLPLPGYAGPVAEDLAKADAEVGQAGIVEVLLGNNPAGATAGLFGSETFAITTLTDRDIIHALCQRRMEELLAQVRWLQEQGVGPYFDMEGEEYLVPPLHSPRDFHEFCVRYDKPVIDLIHEGGGRVHVHCHGRVGQVFQGFLDMGADVVHPFEPPPMGDITARQAKSLARGRLCLEGNIQIADFYERTGDEIRRQTAALIADCFDDRRGLIVCPSASPYIPGAGEVCLETYRAMVETVHQWRE